MIINNEEKLIILKKLEVPGTSQRCHNLGWLDSQDCRMDLQAELVRAPLVNVNGWNGMGIQL